MKKLSATSNIANKIRNTNLPKTKPLMPLFEIISNSIHSIEEAQQAGIISGHGKIEVTCIRNGDAKTLASLPIIDNYPIHSFEIKDNGIGLNSTNLTSFIEADTDHKIEIGGKGVGRFVSLKAFKELNIYSQFLDGNEPKAISFNFRPTKEGFHDFSEILPIHSENGTIVRLNTYKPEYQKNVDFELHSIAREIVSHFQLYFIQKQAPIIIVKNQNGDEFNLATLFDLEFKGDVVNGDFYVEQEKFSIFLTKSLKIQSHKIHFCAHNRSVVAEGLYSKIIEDRKSVV